MVADVLDHFQDHLDILYVFHVAIHWTIHTWFLCSTQGMTGDAGPNGYPGSSGFPGEWSKISCQRWRVHCSFFFSLGREGIKGERGDYGLPGPPGPMGETADAEKGDRGADGK